MPITAYTCWDWEWDGGAAVWTKIENVDPHPPFGTASGAMIYDLARSKVVMENGSTNFAIDVPDRPGDPTDILGRTAPATMERDTSLVWSQPAPTHPASLLYFDMGYDEANSETVLLTYTDTTWTRGAGNWALESPTHAGKGNTQFQTSPSKMVFDQARGKLVALSYSGFTPDPVVVREWDGSDWTNFIGTRPPQTSDNYAFACGYDSTHSKVVYFNWFNGETWTRSGTAWTQRFPAHTPATGSGKLSYLCDDPNSGGLVLLQNTSTPKLWLWDDTDWADITPVSQPSLIDGPPTHLVWDPDRGKVFGAGGIEAYAVNAGLYLPATLIG